LGDICRKLAAIMRMARPPGRGRGGGIGTVSEAVIAWSVLQTEPIAADLIFLGAGWPPVMRAFADHLVIDDRDLAQVNVYAEADEVIAHIAAAEPRQPRVAGPRG
jgi:predicted Rossmann-fold nucleotide-binding protein